MKSPKFRLVRFRGNGELDAISEALDWVDACHFERKLGTLERPFEIHVSTRTLARAHLDFSPESLAAKAWDDVPGEEIVFEPAPEAMHLPTLNLPTKQEPPSCQ